LVKIKVEVPADTPVTTPALETVATLAFVLTQVPPVVGDRVVVKPTQTLVLPVILTTGIAFTVTAAVGAEIQPVAVLVKVKVAVPAATPVTSPLLVTVATAGLLLDQVPPEDGDKPVVAPTQMLLGPLIPTVGSAFTVMAEVGAEIQPVLVLVKVKVAVPADTPETTPAFVTVAMEGSLLAQVPPVVGDKVEVLPTQILLAPVMLTTGEAFTVTGAVGADWQPVAVLVNVKVAVPAATPVTNPLFVTVATPGSLLIQIPFVGERVVVAPIQTLVGPVMLTVGVGLTVIAGVGADIHPVLVLV
jgi:hypothetical protein